MTLMTLNGVMTADPRYLCSSVAELLVLLAAAAAAGCENQWQREGECCLATEHQ